MANMRPKHPVDIVDRALENLTNSLFGAHCQQDFGWDYSYVLYCDSKGYRTLIFCQGTTCDVCGSLSEQELASITEDIIEIETTCFDVKKSPARTIGRSRLEKTVKDALTRLIKTHRTLAKKGANSAIVFANTSGVCIRVLDGEEMDESTLTDSFIEMMMTLS